MIPITRYDVDELKRLSCEISKKFGVVWPVLDRVIFFLEDYLWEQDKAQEKQKEKPTNLRKK